MPWIGFFGVVLFVSDGNEVLEVRFPHTGRPPREGKTTGGKWHHVDGGKCRPHHATMLFEASTSRESRPLEGTRVSFAGGAHRIARTQLSQITDLRALSNSPPLELDTSVKPISIVDLQLPEVPRVTTTSPPDWTFDIDAQTARHNIVLLEFQQTVTVELNNAVTGHEQVVLDGADDFAIFGHFDEVFRTRKELDDWYKDNPPGPGRVRDIDFCWLYSLTKPRNGTLEAWRNGRDLPAPEGISTASRSIFLPRVSTCFPGLF